MSFMNPVDMVEEDAADLQFPKVELTGAIIASEAVKTRSKKVINARHCADTKYITSYYDPEVLNKTLAQYTSGDDQSSSSKTHSSEEQCIVCKCELHEPYIKCHDCESLLCLQCFARGRETHTHRNFHSYVIIRDDVQVFPGAGDWTAQEERILLSTLQTQGYGNWEAVSRALRWKRSFDECKNHYHDCYFGGIFERLLGLTHASQAYFPDRMPYAVKIRSVDPPRHDDITSVQFKLMAGYRCARGEFDTPYDMSAESLLTIIQNNTHRADEQDFCESKENWQLVEEELKCALVRAYNNRLRERKRRYKIMRDNGLIMPNRTLGWISKYAATLGSETNCSRFLSFMQICNPIKFDMLIESLKYFIDLQRSIFRLYELRENGVRSLAGGTLYFNLKQKRLLEQQKLQRQFLDWRKLIPNANVMHVGPFVISHASSTNSRKKAGPMDIIGLPGYAKLSEEERKLCSTARIVPHAFMDYKNMLIAENVKSGHLRLADARRLIKIDVNKTRQVYDFLIEHGHINRPT